MHLDHYRNWRLEYLVIRPAQWQQERETNGWLRDYEVLDRRQAELALDRMMREDPGFVRELHDDLLVQPWGAGTGSAHGDEERLLTLRDTLGSVFSKTGEPPHLARLYICRKKRAPPKPLPDPWKETREALEAARQAPRGYVVVEIVTEEEAPVSGQRVELLLADGEVRTLCTEGQGQARIEGIPRGSCHIRVPDLDGSSWWPADGPQSSPVDQGSKRTHIVAQGECLARIAAQHAIRDWKRIWDAPENEPLRSKRKSPHVLLPGDHVVVPARKVHEIVRPTDQTHRLVVCAQATIALVLIFRDDEGQELAGASYELTYAGLRPDEKRAGRLDGAGTLTEQIPLMVTEVEISFPERREHYRFAVSHLDPLERERDQFLLASAVSRLASLGYVARSAREPSLADALPAVRAFQLAVMGRTDPSGELDAETCRKLEEVYGA